MLLFYHFFPPFSLSLSRIHSLFLFHVYRLFLSTLCAITLSFYLSLFTLCSSFSISLHNPFLASRSRPRNNAHPPAITTAAAADNAANNGRGKGTACRHTLSFVCNTHTERSREHTKRIYNAQYRPRTRFLTQTLEFVMMLFKRMFDRSVLRT